MEGIQKNFLIMVLLIFGLLFVLELAGAANVVEINWNDWIGVILIFIGAAGGFIYITTGDLAFLFIGIAIAVAGIITYVNIYTSWYQPIIGWLAWGLLFFFIITRQLNKWFVKKE